MKLAEKLLNRKGINESESFFDVIAWYMNNTNIKTVKKGTNELIVQDVRTSSDTKGKKYKISIKEI